MPLGSRKGHAHLIFWKTKMLQKAWQKDTGLQKPVWNKQRVPPCCFCKGNFRKGAPLFLSPKKS